MSAVLVGGPHDGDVLEHSDGVQYFELWDEDGTVSKYMPDPYDGTRYVYEEPEEQPGE
jgi:hypothetical protein